MNVIPEVGTGPTPSLVISKNFPSSLANDVFYILLRYTYFFPGIF